MKEFEKMNKKLFVRGSVFLLGFVTVSLVVFFSLPPKGEIPVLMYHYIYPSEHTDPAASLNVSVESFGRQMWFLNTFGFRPISLDTYYDIRKGNRKAAGREVVITFDDGERSYLEHAVPILRKFQIPSVNFLIVDHLETGGRAMTLEEVKGLMPDPLITFGSHTLSHSNLKESPPQRVRHEVFESKQRLEEMLGVPVRYFCYPLGVFNDYAVQAVEEAGYRLAFTTSYKKLEGRSPNDFAVPRIKIPPSDGLFVFWLRASGLATYGERFKMWFRPWRTAFSGKMVAGPKPSASAGSIDFYQEAA